MIRLHIHETFPEEQIIGVGGEDEQRLTQTRLKFCIMHNSTFTEHFKILIFYQKTHELNIHQIVVRVCGWKSISPVSVDKVGTYFRYMKPDCDDRYEVCTFLLIIGIDIGRHQVLNEPQELLFWV